MTDAPEPDDKPKRPRKTKAEREAERQAQMKAEAEKPLTAAFWGILAGVLLFLTVCFFVDILSVINYQSTSSSSQGATGEIVMVVLATIYSALGRTWGTLIFGAIGLFCLYKAIRRRMQVGSWDA
ncbi:MAG: hypothetical protein LCI00_25050 [Chloroflexi bacterium]|nr:hypothetical protein [Chloroflexota bacterium]MCC6895745.1 hypothetical protein [Anaerolineae bacterium]